MNTRTRPADDGDGPSARRDRTAGPALPPFDLLVARHGGTVLRVCRAIVGDADADDAWSETFLSALRSYADLPGDANLEAWLVTIAQRRSIDLYRARARRPSPTSEPHDDGVATAPPDPLDATLAAALAALGDKQRWCVVYHHVAGLPYDDVAALVGGSPAAARRAAADGIAILRRRIADGTLRLDTPSTNRPTGRTPTSRSQPAQEASRP